MTGTIGAMKKPDHPYGGLPAQAFWRSAVAEPGLFGLHDLWASRWRLPSNARFATYGSCFAQHISRALVARNLPWINAEPAPRHTPEAVARDFNYGIFSARTANIYTTPQLLILARMAAGDLDPDLAELWETGGRFYNSLRPAIEPGGFSSREQALASRRSMVRAFRRSVERADVFVFTLGLTEGWENAETGQPYAMCPGTVAGSFDAERHAFRNYGVAQTREALDRALTLLRAIRPGLKVLLTVSPVPLTATASGQHVLVATTYSKSVLRAVAAEVVQDDADTDYFPSYEIISGAPARAAFFEPNLRSVARAGVDFVMGHFFAGLDLGGDAAEPGAIPDDAAEEAAMEAEMQDDDLVCEESILDTYNRG